MKSLIVISFFIVVNNISFSQWQWNNPKPSGSDYNDIQLFDSSTFLVVGSFGTVVETSDKGKSWESNFDICNNELNLTNTFFIDDNVGWCLGTTEITYDSLKYSLVSTTDGGKNWKLQELNDDYKLQDIFFNSYYSGWLTCQDGKLLRSVDGGKDWSLVDLRIIVHSICFISETVGWIAGQEKEPGGLKNVLYKTYNGGNTWEFLSATHFDGSIGFINDNQGYFYGGKFIEVTKDGGYSWYTTTLDVKNIICVSFGDTSTGYLLTQYEYYDEPPWPLVKNIIYKTTDGGNNWFEINHYDGSNINQLKFLDADNGWYVGLHGIIKYTSDGGNSWNFISDESVGGLYEDIQFIDSNKIYISNRSTGFIKSENGGVTWSNPSNPVYVMGQPTTMHFSDEMNGYIGTAAHKLFRTSDGGYNWSLSFDEGAYIYSVYCINKDVAYLASDTRIYKTTNSGTDWEMIFDYENTGWGYDVIDEIIFFSADKGIAVASHNVLITQDGGESWNRVYTESENYNYLRSIHFVSDDFGYITTTKGYILKTANGGLNWTKIYSGYDISINDIYIFENNRDGYAVGDNGTILKTSDGGITWEQEKSLTEFTLHSIEFGSKNRGIITSTWGILSIGVNGNIDFISDNFNTSVSEFKLLQNYPNPFNPTTRIKYQIHESGLVTLKIYDVLGREVKTVVNEFKPSGKYEVELNVNELSSGVYFYQLKAGSFVKTNKMILLR